MNDQIIESHRQIPEPEITVAVGEGFPVFAAAGKQAAGADNDLFFCGVIDRAADEFPGDAAVIDPGLQPLLRQQDLRALDVVGQALLRAEADRFRGAGLHAAGLLCAVIQQMGAAGAFLGDIQLGIHVYDAIGAGIPALAAAAAEFGLDEYQPVIPAQDGPFRTGFDAGSLPAVAAQAGDIVDLHLGDAALHVLIHLQPELADLRLGLGVGRPVVSRVLILAGQLAVVAAAALCHIDHKCVCHEQSPFVSARCLRTDTSLL